MPDSPMGLLLYLVLFLPGFVYQRVWDRRAPHLRLTGFREGATIVFGSVIANLVVLVLFTGLQAIAPMATPDVGRLLGEGQAYVATHYASLATWGLGMLAAATGLAAAAALYAARDPHESTQSAWWRWFEVRRQELVKENGGINVLVKVCCTFKDGAQIEGSLVWFNQIADDIADRDLVLVPPLTYVAPDGQHRQTLDSHVVVISAREVTRLQVVYELDPDEAPPPSPPPDSAGCAGATTV